MKTNLSKKLGAVLCALIALSLSTSAFAAERKQARANDVASEYVLENNGDLFRIIRGTDIKCQVTTRVSDFKISQHPNDVAMIYFKRDGDLYLLRNGDRRGQCPIANKSVLVTGVRKYSVVSTTDTTIVNVALSNSGELAAWDNTNVRVSKSNVSDYKMYQYYGVSGKPFSTYVLFAINYGGSVLKVKGVNPEESKWDESRRFSSIDDFMVLNRLN